MMQYCFKGLGGSPCMYSRDDVLARLSRRLVNVNESPIRRLTRAMSRATTIVVGAGPSGIAAVGALIARRQRVVWVDPNFTVGALARYKAVPANTKLDVLLPGFVGFLPQGLPSAAAERALARMQVEATTLHANPDPCELGWTTLGSCQELMQTMTAALLTEPGVSACRGRAIGLERQVDGTWSVQLAGSHGIGVDARDLRAPSVVLAPGGSPSPVPPQLRLSAWASGARRPRVLHLEQAPQFERLPALLAGARTVGVVGGGHSGVVISQRLHEHLGRRVSLFVRSPLRLACWDAHAGAYGAWAFRGLKGAAAEYAVRHGLVGLTPPGGEVVPGLELHHSSVLSKSAAVSADLDAVVFCLGYTRAPLPLLTHSGGRPLDTIARHGAPGGALFAPSGEPIDGLFGIGLAFSDDEYTSGDAYGEVGFFPFAARAAEIAQAVAA